MRVLVNFVPLLPRGGGLQNARNLWRTLPSAAPQHEFLAFARPELGLPAGASERTDIRTVSPRSVAARLRWENVDFPRMAREWGADVMWTPMGAGPLRGPVPRVMGWHDSSLAYPESVVHRRLGFKERLSERMRGWMARNAGRGAARITVQTETMRRRLSRVWGVPESRFHIVSNGPSTYLVDEAPAPVRPEGTPVVLVIAEAKPAKNLEIVPATARLLAERGREVRFVLTVPPRGDRFTEFLDRAVDAEGGVGTLERIGRIPHEDLGALYRSASAVFLPSLFESFSATYLESMHFGVPLVTSDMDFARELCGPAALYADPLDAVACADALEEVLDDDATRASLRDEGFRRLPTFPTWERRVAAYLEALESAVTPGGPEPAPTEAPPDAPAEASTGAPPEAPAEASTEVEA